MKLCSLLLLLIVTDAFTVSRQHRRGGFHSLASTTPDSAELLESLSEVGYEVTVEKPLGVVFGENRPPFSGLVVDDVEGGMNGGVAGIRVGDQLMGINGEYVVNGDFDSVMDKLRNYESPLNLVLYRGSISSLLTIAMNKNGMVEPEEEEEEAIVMDENYEAPIITMEEYEDDTISVSKVAGDALKSLGNMFGGGLKSITSTETIQLEGDDAKTGMKDL